MSSTVAPHCSCGPGDRWDHVLTERVAMRDKDGLWVVCGVRCRRCGEQWQTQEPAVAEVVTA